MSVYAVPLEGWQQLSTWGFDDTAGSYYAQLTRNTSSDDDGPDVWITPPQWPVMYRSSALAQAIAHTTGHDLQTVRDALNASLGSPDSPHRVELAQSSAHRLPDPPPLP